MRYENHEIKQQTAELRALTDRVESGEEEALPELRKWLGDHRQGWGRLAEHAGQLLDRRLDVLAGDNQIVRDQLRGHIERQKLELGYGESTPLEQLLIDTVVIASADVHLAELVLANTPVADSVQCRAIEAHVKRGHKRLATACKQLALVRRLLVTKPVRTERGTVRKTRRIR